jgi:hypothetical protein
MAASVGTLEAVAQQIALALQPLQDLFGEDNVTDLFAELGLQFPPDLLQPAFKTAIANAAAAAGALSNLITQLSTAIQAGDNAAILQAGEQLIQQIIATINSFTQVSTELSNLATSLPGMNSGEVTTFAENLAVKLVGYLLISYLEDVQPPIVGAGNLLGFLDYIPNPGIAGDPTHPPYILRQLQLSKLGRVLSSPSDALRILYGWGDPSFDGVQLVARLNSSLTLFGIPSQLNSPTSLTTSLFTLQSTPPGLSATLTDQFFSNYDLTIALSTTWSLQIHMAGTFTPGITLSVTPPANATLTSTAALNGQLQTNVVAKGPDAAHQLIVFGQTGGSRVQVDLFSFGVGLNVTANAIAGTADAEPQVSLQITGGKVIIDTTDADGFLADVLSGVNVQAGFDFNATWRPDTGLHITGGAQLEIDLPLHLDLGPVTLPTLYLIGGVANDAITLEVSVALGVTLGPIDASVDRLGMLGTLTFPQQGGNLGPANLALGFKPPNGLGIAVDAGLVTGGGYLSYDPSKGQYAGILQLSLVDTIGITVIGVLDTVMPDGSSGYSFLLIITFTLPAIQLGLGFTLNRVGGLGGVNRTMNTDTLEAGFRAHTLGAIMFPADPIDNAPQIISDIRNFFPIATGRYLFGPLLELGWGTPTLITLTVGVLLEVPDPIRMAILGLIDAGLPTEDDALLQLHIEVLGIIDFGAKTLAIDGTLFDSSIVIYALVGDLALRVSWGSNPNFLFSLGGFNPNFNTDGLDVPKLARLSVSLGNGSNPRISADSYFALTSNSVQFGADVQAYAAAGGFSIQGYLGFDVLIIISPFSFEFDFTASFDVKYDGDTLLGLNVNGTFQGPTPWHFHGEVSISLFFFSVSASVDLTWGSSTQATIPSQPVLPDLFKALQNPQSWSAALPPATTVAVSLATQKLTDKTLCVHPIGTLQVKETVVPLDLPIARYGNATPSDGTEFSIQSVQINSQTETIQTIQDYFAPGQFLNLSDADKLSKPSFEEMDAGVNIGSSAILNGQDSPRTVVYQEYYIYDPNNFSSFSRPYLMPARIHLALSAQGAGFASQVKNTGLQKYSKGPTTPAIIVDEPQYVVTSVLDLSIRADVLGSSGGSYFQAQAALGAYLSANPAEAGNLQIMPLHEVAA